MSSFRFENAWLEEPDLEEIVCMGWNKEDQVDVMHHISSCTAEMNQWGRKLRSKYREAITECKQSLEELRGCNDTTSIQRYNTLHDKMTCLIMQEEAFGSKGRSIECWKVADMWQSMKRTVLASEGFRETAFQLLGALQNHQKHMFVMMLWSLWKRRNENIWEGTQRTIRDTVNHAKEAISDWETMKKRCDVGIGSVNSHGVGLCVRDEKGHFIRAKILYHSGFPPAREAEALGRQLCRGKQHPTSTMEEKFQCKDAMVVVWPWNGNGGVHGRAMS
ncbi:hypothetical protein SESBI_16697 [Sesbania bispinosa]|nr:hypothetical protein SESBI_16697 [Sesbania bispinosa]